MGCSVARQRNEGDEIREQTRAHERAGVEDLVEAEARVAEGSGLLRG